MTPVTLHVGTEKTGSTSFQNLCDRHRGALLERGVLFPASVFTRKVPGQPERTSGHLQLIRDLAAGDISAFEQERRAVPHDRLLLSAENIFHYADDAPLRALRAVLGEAPLTLVVVLRRQDAWLASYYAESVQGGWNREGRSFDRFAQDIAASGMLDYAALLQRMERIFKPRLVRVIDYDAARAGPGVVQAMLNAGDVPLDPARADEMPRSHTSRYSASGLEAHRCLNSLARVFWSKDMHRWTQDMLGATRPGPGAPGPLPSARTRAALMDAVDLPNALLSARYLEGATFGIPAAWRAQAAPPRDGAAIARHLSSGLGHFAQVRDDASSFSRRKRDVPPVFALGAEEAGYLLSLLSAARHVLGYEADALAYLAAFQPGPLAVFAGRDADRTRALQSDVDRHDFPNTPLVHACAPDRSPWTLPGVGVPDLVLAPASRAADALAESRRNRHDGRRVVIYPDAAPQDGAPVTSDAPSHRIGGLAVHDLPASRGAA